MRNVEPEAVNLVGVLVEDKRWHRIDIDLLANRACEATIRHLGRDPSQFDIGLLACDDGRIAELNSRFRDQPKPTNVLSWPTKGHCQELATSLATDRSESGNLGDIAISWDACYREAGEAGKQMDEHVIHLVVHSCLHLLGYKHKCDEDARGMEQLETEVLASLGVSDPYGN